MAQSLSPKERLKLIKSLNALPLPQFEEIVFALDPPQGILSASTGSQGNRAKELLGWAEGPSGKGIEDILDLLGEYISLDWLTPSITESVETPKPLRIESPEGLVPLASPFYIERPPIEADCYREIVWPSALIRIKAPRQMGKTSLLVRILDYCRQPDQQYQCLRLSFQRADTTLLNDLEGFMRWFCISVTEELGLPDRLDNYWKGSGGVIGRCQRYFDRYLLPEIGGPLVLGLDEVDQVFEHPETATNFFGMLRDWHEQGKLVSRWGNLRLIIVHSKEVYVPLSINQSPFNVGVPVELRELNLAEVEDMIERHGLTLSEADQADLMTFLGGHPYLLRAALHRIALGRSSPSMLLRNAPTEGGLYNDHLRRHLNNLQENPELIAAFQTVLSSESPEMIGSTEAFKLSSMGLVKYRGNQVIPFCELYRQYFRKRLEVV